jgi:Na+/melibiose symporter-like transporter
VSESWDEGHHAVDVVGTALVTGGLFALVLALIGTGSIAWTSVRTLALLAAAAVLIALFILWERWHADPMVPLRFFRRRAFSTASAVALLVGFAFLGVLYLVVIYLQNVKGYSPLQAGIRTLPMTLTQALTAANAGALDRRLGPRMKMAAGMLLLSGGLFGLAQVQVASSYNAIWPFEALLGIGMGLTLPAVSAAGMAAVDADQSGIASGVINASRQIGGALGIAVLGSIAAMLARADWMRQSALLGATAHAQSSRLTTLVLGGQGKVIGRLAGHPAEMAGLESFVYGLRGALLISSALTLAGAGVALVGLRHRRPSYVTYDGAVWVERGEAG